MLRITATAFLLFALVSAVPTNNDNDNRIRADMENPAHAGIVDLNKLWPQGIIPFEIDQSLKFNSFLIYKAINIFHEKTCLRFIPKSEEDVNFVNFTSMNECRSSVGMQNESQFIYLSQNCLHLPIILHQIAHTIGLYNEINRHDRDQYVTIYWEHVKNDMKPALEKLSIYDHNVLGESFDYDSIMMTDYYAYSKNPHFMTIQAKNGQTLIPIWSKSGLSAGDIRQINRLYECFGEKRPEPYLPTLLECNFTENNCKLTYKEGYNWIYGEIIRGQRYTKGIRIEGPMQSGRGFQISFSIKEKKEDCCIYMRVYINGPGNVWMDIFVDKNYGGEQNFTIDEKSDKWISWQLEAKFPNSYNQIDVYGYTSKPEDIIAIDYIKFSLNPCGI